MLAAASMNGSAPGRGSPPSPMARPPTRYSGTGEKPTRRATPPSTQSTPSSSPSSRKSRTVWSTR